MKRHIPTRVGTNPPATSHQRLGNLLWHDSSLGLHDAGCYPSCDSGNWADLHICDELTSYPIFGLNRSPIWHFDWRVWLWAKEANSTTWRREGKCCQWVGIQHAKQFTFIYDHLSPFVQKNETLVLISTKSDIISANIYHMQCWINPVFWQHHVTLFRSRMKFSVADASGSWVSRRVHAVCTQHFISTLKTLPVRNAWG